MLRAKCVANLYVSGKPELSVNDNRTEELFFTLSWYRLRHYPPVYFTKDNKVIESIIWLRINLEYKHARGCNCNISPLCGHFMH